jgi:alkyldihydroxyacetonephosphate synthase
MSHVMPSFAPSSQPHDTASRLDVATAQYPEPADAEHEAAWGFADTEFRSDGRGVVQLSGKRYELCGLELPDLMPFASEVLSIDVDPKALYEPLPPAPLPATLCDASFLDSLRALLDADMVAVSDDARRRHAHGHTQEEIFTLRYGRLARAPDVVVFPSSEEQVVALVRLARERGACVIPFGGGTNVTEALRCPDGETRPIVSVDMRRMNRILWIDEVNRTACIEAGAVGRHLEAALQARGYTFGHEPDSVEFSTLGGWIATRSSGMKKNLYGNIEDLLVDVRMVTAEGVFGGRAPNPRESIGIDTRQLVLGSEGSLGIITSAIVKISPVPEEQQFGSVVFPDFETGLSFLRELSASKDVPASVRLVDNLQFRFGLALKPKATSWKAYKSRFEAWVVTGLKGMRPDKLVACTLVYEGS